MADINKHIQELVLFFYNSVAFSPEGKNLHISFLTKDKMGPAIKSKMNELFEDASFFDFNDVRGFSIKGNVIDDIEQWFIYILDNEEDDDSYIIDLFHELTHVYTCNCSDIVFKSNSLLSGYMFWREFVADFFAYNCYFAYNANKNCEHPSHTLSRSIKNFKKHHDLYDLVSIIAIEIILKSNFTYFPAENAEDIEFLGFLRELVIICENGLAVNRNKIPVSIFGQISAVLKYLNCDALTCLK